MTATRASLVGLPPEIRREIFLTHFQTLRIRGNDPCECNALAILQVNRQTYHDAAPLVLPNVAVYCCGNVDVIHTLTKIGSERITKLRHLKVHHCPIGFKLFPATDKTEPDATGEITEEEGYDSDESHGSAGSGPLIDNGIRYFHLGAVLGLFPGLQLDLLEVFCGTEAGSFTGLQTTDCFESLLEADGYRELWLEAVAGDGPAWNIMPSTERWKHTALTKFKPYKGWLVRIQVPSEEWADVLDGSDPVWTRAQEAGFTLVEGLDSDDEETRNESDGPDIIIKRGDADFRVKPNDGRLLRCIERTQHTESQTFFKRASAALKRLFQENNWEDIQAMDGFDDGSHPSWSPGDMPYVIQCGLD